jgi:membrane-associated phospholipid phosphatase
VVRLLALDRRLLRLMRTRGHSHPGFERRVSAFSKTGEHAACWFALGAAGLALSRSPQRHQAWRRGLEATAFAYGLNYAIKLSVKRPRPRLEGLPPLSGVVSGLSFPSAHATTSFAAAGTYARAVPAAAPLLYGGAAMFAISRPYLGVHYPSDVAAGALIGSAVARAWPR